MRIERRVSGTLMAANLIAIVLVIAIHYGSKVPPDASGNFRWNYVIQGFLIDGCARIAVPFFALIAGFFLANRLDDPGGYISVIRSKIKTLLVPYIVASAAILFAVVVLKAIFVPEANQEIGASSLLYQIVMHPVSVHMWFLRDLILLTILFPVLLNQNRLVSGLLCFCFGVCWLFEIQIFPIVGGWYLFSIETIFFFCVGGLLFRRSSILHHIIDANIATKRWILVLWFVLIGLRVYIDPNIDIWYVKHYSIGSILLYKISILFGIVAVIQLSERFANNRRIVYLSGLTFFVYLYHSIPLSHFRSITEKLISKPFSFYLDFPIAVISVFLAAHLLSIWFPSVYAFISGGRDPNKALKRVS